MPDTGTGSTPIPVTSFRYNLEVGDARAGTASPGADTDTPCITQTAVGDMRRGAGAVGAEDPLFHV